MFNNNYDYLIVYGGTAHRINKNPETISLLINRFHFEFGRLFGNMRELNFLIAKYEKF